jgi:hypothetical protein
MPPKAAAKKGGETEDFSDVTTLPEANLFKFSVVFKTFFSAENRLKITKRTNESLGPTSEDKVKLITREELVNYGKTK